MNKVLSLSIVCLLALGTSAFAADKSGDDKSGLQPGERPGAYQVLDATGPSEGKKLCYRCQYGAKPVVNIFTRKLDDSVAKLVKEIDTKVGENKDKGMRAFVVLLTDDPDAASAQLKKFAKKHGIKNVPLTSFENTSGPGSYKIAKDAGLTIMMWNKMRVKVNHASAKTELSAEKIKEVVADTKKILD
jgi:hypothetical protein